MHRRLGRRCPVPEAWSHDSLGDEPAERHHDDRHADDEVPVAGDVHPPAGNQQLRGRLGDAEQQRVELARKQVGREPAGDAGEGSRDADDRVSTGGREQRTGQRNHHHEGRVAGLVGHDRGEYHDRREPRLRRVADGRTHRSARETGLLRDSRAQHDQQHVTERREPRQCAWHFDQESLEVGARQQAGRSYGLLVDRVDRVPPRGGTDDADHHDREDHPEKDQHRIGQAIAYTLDGVERATESPVVGPHRRAVSRACRLHRPAAGGGPASQASATRTQAVPPSGISASLKS